MDYRDPRNGPDIDVALVRIGRNCATLHDALRALVELMEPDVELTPAQAELLADDLGSIGLMGAAILATDLDRTNRREARAR